MKVYVGGDYDLNLKMFVEIGMTIFLECVLVSILHEALFPFAISFISWLANANNFLMSRCLFTMTYCIMIFPSLFDLPKGVFELVNLFGL